MLHFHNIQNLVIGVILLEICQVMFLKMLQFFTIENGNGTVRIGGAIGRVKDGETLVIPKYISNGEKVVRVSGGGFKYCAGLKKVELADGFQAVGNKYVRLL